MTSVLVFRSFARIILTLNSRIVRMPSMHFATKVFKMV